MYDIQKPGTMVTQMQRFIAPNQDSHRSQEFEIFHDVETVKSKTNKVVGISYTLQFQYCLPPRQTMTVTHCTPTTTQIHSSEGGGRKYQANHAKNRNP
jgi:hypothetical protein